jgi:RimJ/RimL family protein N-acetyltransferase
MTEDIRLREVRDEDVPVFYLHQSEPEACRMAGFPAREEEVFTTHWEKIRRDSSNVLRTIVRDEEPVGNVVSFVMGEERQVGYWIGQAHWGQGIATRALGQFLKDVTERPLYAYAAKQNAGSARVLAKCGFVKRRKGQEEDGVAFVLECSTVETTGR